MLILSRGDQMQRNTYLLWWFQGSQCSGPLLWGNSMVGSSYVLICDDTHERGTYKKKWLHGVGGCSLLEPERRKLAGLSKLGKLYFLLDPPRANQHYIMHMGEVMVGPMYSSISKETCRKKRIYLPCYVEGTVLCLELPSLLLIIGPFFAAALVKPWLV